MSINVLPRLSGIASLRQKNQLTIPEAAIKAIGARVGDRFLVSVHASGIDLVPIRETYAGALADVYPADAVDEIRRERDAWDR